MGFGPEGARSETMAAYDGEKANNSEYELPCGERDYI
jgi:hypothetical protein